MSPDPWLISGCCWSQTVYRMQSASGWQIIFPPNKSCQSSSNVLALHAQPGPNCWRFLAGPLPIITLTAGFAEHILEDREIFVWDQRGGWVCTMKLIACPQEIEMSYFAFLWQLSFTEYLPQVKWKRAAFWKHFSHKGPHGAWHLTFRPNNFKCWRATQIGKKVWISRGFPWAQTIKRDRITRNWQVYNYSRRF